MTKFFLDGGTHLGQGLRKLARLNHVDNTWQVHTWEANPHTFHRLDQGSHFAFPVQRHNQALSDHDGVIALSIETTVLKREHAATPMGQGSSILSRQTWADHLPNNQFLETVDVECIDFASWIQTNCRFGDHIIVKLDIEGAEYQVLERMFELGVADWPRHYYIEWHAHMINDADLLEREHRLREKFAKQHISYEDWH